MNAELHPCYSEAAHKRYARLHLPVAPSCNIQCGFCHSQAVGHPISYPGSASRVLSVTEALELVERVVAAEERLRVVGIAGPGEPLANPETFEVLHEVGRRYPGLILCLSTNGLLLPEKLPRLLETGIRSITVTVNALSLPVAERIYARADISQLLKNQLEGLRGATYAGCLVKVNTVLIPGLNEKDAVEIGRYAADAGALLQNIVPLVPGGRFKDHRPPTRDEIEFVREQAGKYIRQFRFCKQCRGDAIGVPGEGASNNRCHLVGSASRSSSRCPSGRSGLSRDETSLAR